MQTIQTFITFLHQAAPLLLGVIVVLGAVSTLFTTLSALLNGVVKAFPSLKGGWVDHAANLCEAWGMDVGKAIDVFRAIAAKLGVNAVPRSERPTPVDGIPKVMVLALAAGLCFWARPAQAADVTMGVSVPMLQVRLANPAGGGATSSFLNGGAGYQLSVGFLPTTIAGRSYDMLGLQALALGKVGSDITALSLAAGFSTLQGMVGVVFGADLLANYGYGLEGLLAANVHKRDLFTGLTFSLNFDLGDPVHPDTGLLKGGTFHLANPQS